MLQELRSSCALTALVGYVGLVVAHRGDPWHLACYTLLMGSAALHLALTRFDDR